MTNKMKVKRYDHDFRLGDGTIAVVPSWVRYEDPHPRNWFIGHYCVLRKIDPEFVDSFDETPLPCPWCGGAPRVASHTKRVKEVFYSNEECPVSAYVYADTKAEAIARWNRRAPA